ncbi:3-deoxy-7-phosphoheptulonate synthase [Plantactinospora sp. WMMB334]|uniref:3-deoxy-7-phosphoheptulonate synthase n=1 Tax=Plantactinospora sp. WMMB334 TaxID=3404119 RepID=UPI003B9237F6
MTALADPPLVAQQPAWDPPGLAARVLRDIAGRPPLVEPEACAALSAELGSAARGRAFVLQGGDCAELFVDSAPHRVRAKADQLHGLADAMERIVGLPVVRVGRLAGQYAKPRSSPVEDLPDGSQLPVYRGDAVNSAEPTAAARRADPRRIARAYDSAARVLATLLPAGLILPSGAATSGGELAPVYTSHEALLLEYERALLRRRSGSTYSASAHMLWIGDRTRQLDGPHVEFAGGIRNPIGVKIGPGAAPDEVACLVERLVRDRSPGELVLIFRLGVDRVASGLAAMVDAVGSYAESVLWMCDPMHANTRRRPGGEKTRVVTDVVAEAEQFVAVLRDRGVWPGGLHLELTPDRVLECVDDTSSLTAESGSARYTSPCDPRLNHDQAAHLVRRVADALRPPAHRPGGTSS